MASAFAHAFSAFAFSRVLPDVLRKPSVWITGMICSAIPDLDVIGFAFDVHYLDFWGHRGFTHSFAFALMLALLVAFTLYRKTDIRSKWILVAYLFVCTGSHGILDAVTTGGEGIAFFSPFDNGRYFLPWRVVKVSPIGAGAFFSEWGLRVLKSEAFWIGIPSLAIILGATMLRRFRASSKN